MLAAARPGTITAPILSPTISPFFAAPQQNTLLTGVVEKTRLAGKALAQDAKNYLFYRGIDLDVLPAILHRGSASNSNEIASSPAVEIKDLPDVKALEPQPSLLGTNNNSPVPPSPKRKNPLKWIFDNTFARTDRAICVTTTMGMIEFAGLSPLVNYATSWAAKVVDPSIVPQFIMPSIDSVARIGVVCAGIGAVLFGINGFPQTAQKILRPTVGRALSKVMDPKTVNEGFVFGKAPEIRANHGKVLFNHPRFGEYTMADPITWAHEIGINLGFYPAIGWALNIPVLNMLPAAGLSIFATIGTARMSKIWGSERRPFWMIALGRTAVFSSMNAVAPLAGSLEKAGVLSAASGYAIQAACILAISAGAYLVVKPKPTLKEVPPLNEPSSGNVA